MKEQAEKNLVASIRFLIKEALACDYRLTAQALELAADTYRAEFRCKNKRKDKGAKKNPG